MVTFLKIAGHYSGWNIYRKMRQGAGSYCIRVDDPTIFTSKCRQRSDETVANIMITQIRQLDAMLAKVLKAVEGEFLSSGGIREAMSAARRHQRGY